MLGKVTKEELILKVPILRQQKRFIIKIRSYFRSKNCKKRWDENNSKDAILSCKNSCFSL
jgi:hypothetical protein